MNMRYGEWLSAVSSCYTDIFLPVFLEPVSVLLEHL